MPSSPPPSSPPGRRARPRGAPLPCRRCRHRPSTPPCRRRRKSTASPSPSSLRLPSPPSPPSHHHPHRRRSWRPPPRYRDRLWRGYDRPAAETITSPPPSVSPRRHSGCPLTTAPVGNATTSSLSPIAAPETERKMRESCDVVLLFFSHPSAAVPYRSLSPRRCSADRAVH